MEEEREGSVVLYMMTIHVKMLQSPVVRAGEIRVEDKYLGVRA